MLDHKIFNVLSKNGKACTTYVLDGDVSVLDGDVSAGQLV